MNTEDFVDAIKENVRDASIKNVQEILEEVPGRSPEKKLVELSNWYNSLSVRDQNYIKQVIEESVDTALFGILCVLDGVRSVEPAGESGYFEILYHKNGDVVKLAPNDSLDYLHDLYNSE